MNSSTSLSLLDNSAMDEAYGKAAKYVRNNEGLTQTEIAELLGVSQVHVSNFENGKSAPSFALIKKYKELFGVDLSVLAWCLCGKVESLPQPVRASARRLQDAWRRELGLQFPEFQ